MPLYNKQITDPFKLKLVKNRFEEGSLAMVKVGLNSSSSTEYFFLLNKAPEMDGRYSVFGKVISGMFVIKSLDSNDYITSIELTY